MLVSGIRPATFLVVRLLRGANPVSRTVPIQGVEILTHPTPTPLAAPTVLVVDDDDTICDTVRFILEEEGYCVQTAAHGGAALEVLRASPAPMVALLDWFMPDMTGERLLYIVAAERALAQRHAYIIMSATTTDRLHLDAFPPQLIAARVHKPFDIDTLLNAVKHAKQRLHASVRHATVPPTEGDDSAGAGKV